MTACHICGSPKLEPLIQKGTPFRLVSSDAVSYTHLTLPVNQYMSKTDVETVASEVLAFVNR